MTNILSFFHWQRVRLPRLIGAVIWLRWATHGRRNCIFAWRRTTIENEIAELSAEIPVKYFNHQYITNLEERGILKKGKMEMNGVPNSESIA